MSSKAHLVQHSRFATSKVTRITANSSRQSSASLNSISSNNASQTKIKPPNRLCSRFKTGGVSLPLTGTVTKCAIIITLFVIRSECATRQLETVLLCPSRCFIQLQARILVLRRLLNLILVTLQSASSRFGPFLLIKWFCKHDLLDFNFVYDVFSEHCCFG